MRQRMREIFVTCINGARYFDLRHVTANNWRVALSSWLHVKHAKWTELALRCCCTGALFNFICGHTWSFWLNIYLGVRFFLKHFTKKRLRLRGVKQ